MNDIAEIGVDDLDDEGDIDGDDKAEYESTDSMTSANHVSSYALPLKKETEIKHPFLVKRASTTGGAMFYQARAGLPHQLAGAPLFLLHLLDHPTGEHSAEG